MHIHVHIYFQFGKKYMNSYICLQGHIWTQKIVAQKKDFQQLKI